MSLLSFTVELLSSSERIFKEMVAQTNEKRNVAVAVDEMVAETVAEMVVEGNVVTNESVVTSKQMVAVQNEMKKMSVHQSPFRPKTSVQQSKSQSKMSLKVSKMSFHQTKRSLLEVSV